MTEPRYFTFEPFCLDVLDERLWNRETNVPLSHKAFDVLARLVRCPNQLVTKADLMASVWPDTAVSDAVLTTVMREIRVGLGDPARSPRFIQTVHGRGYRFIAPVDATATRSGSRTGTATTDGARESAGTPRFGGLVGREAEWARLSDWCTAAERGARRVVFIAGEAGIGKSSLVDAFAIEMASSRGVRIGRGQCVEQYGAGEAYLPILEALGRMARDPGARVARILETYAPSWLPHLAFVSDRLVEPARPVRPERMLRELAEGIEVLTADEPLILVLEDLHWSDHATLDWLAYLARRRDTARLLVLGTYRPVETALHQGPLRAVLADLRHQPQTAEIVLDYLSKRAVHAYIQQRLSDVPAVERLAEIAYQRTGGHPLFLSGIVDTLTHEVQAAPHSADDALRAMARSIPLNVRQFVECQLENVSEDDRAILDAASAAGDPFCIAAVTATLSLSEEQIEARCAAMANVHRIFISDGVVGWPDGTVSARYRFRHALFHEAAYARTSPERRARLHRHIGLRLEAAHTAQASTIAAELAVHFEHGRDLDKAASYLEQAASNAVRRSAYLEARRHLEHALTIVTDLPDNRVRRDREATLWLLLGQALETTQGWGVDAVRHAYSRAREECIALGDDKRLMQATWGLIAVSLVRADLHTTKALSRELLGLAKTRKNPLFRMAAHTELAGAALVQGRSVSARRHFKKAEALAGHGRHEPSVATFGMDLGIFARIWATHCFWHEGFPDEARVRARETLEAARRIHHPFTLTVALAYGAMLGQFRRDIEEVERLADAAIAHATEHGFPYYRAWGEVLRAWSRAARTPEAAAAAEARRCIDALRTSARLRLPYYLSLLAEMCAGLGQFDAALTSISDAFAIVRETDERWWEAELHRVRGEVLRAAGGHPLDVEACFRTALEQAHAQRAKVLELRAATSLARLWQDRKRRDRARLVLARTYDSFVEGFETADLRDARAVLEERSPRRRVGRGVWQ